MGFGTVLGLTAGLISVETGAELLLKPNSSAKKYDWRFGLGVAAYVAVAVLFAITLRSDDAGLAVINTVWQASNIAAVFLISIIFLGETVTVWDYAGAGLAFLGAVVMIIPQIT
jgi:multidrug transporter EmrE-like cation transporter